MGLFDKVRTLAGEHGDKLEGVVDKAAELIDDKTGGKYTDKIESGADAAKGFLGEEEAGGGGQEPPSRRTPLDLQPPSSR